jgi:hypothetical protein
MLARAFWLGTESSGGLLWIRQWNLGFYKRLQIDSLDLLRNHQRLKRDSVARSSSRMTIQVAIYIRTIAKSEGVNWWQTGGGKLCRWRRWQGPRLQQWHKHAKRQFPVVSCPAFYFLFGFCAFIYFIPFFISLYLLSSLLYFLRFYSVLIFFLLPPTLLDPSPTLVRSVSKHFRTTRAS